MTEQIGPEDGGIFEQASEIAFRALWDGAERDTKKGLLGIPRERVIDDDELNDELDNMLAQPGAGYILRYRWRQIFRGDKPVE